MTEKRFTKTSKNGYWQIKDNQADYKETFDLTNPQLIVDRLNALHEENTRLKEQLECDKQLFTKKQLHEENQRLKKQLQTEHQQLENAILLERTRMGKNSLKQYKEAIQ